MNLLLLTGYNNYFNRILKKENTIADYKAAVLIGSNLNYITLNNINFNSNDGVATTLVLGAGDLPWEEEATPDYLIAYTEENTVQTIKSRWFILEIERVRGGQFRVALKRDLLADFYSEVMEAPCFVEKGYIADTTNPLLFNAEGMTFNEIKKSEKLLKDETKSAWLVGYLKKGDNATIEPINYTPEEAFQNIVDISSKPWYSCISYPNDPAAKVFYCVDSENSGFYWKMQVPGNSWPTYVDTAVKLKWDLNGQNRGYSYDDFNGSYQGMSQEAMIIRAPGWWSMGIDSPYCKRWSTEIIDKMLGPHRDIWEAIKVDGFTKLSTAVVPTYDIGDLMNYNGKYFEKDNKVYKLTIAPGNTNRQETFEYNGNDTITNALWNCVLPDVRETENGTMTLAVATSNPTKPRAKFIYKGVEYSIVATEETLPGTLSFTMAGENARNIVEDAVYNMFALPISPSALGINSEVLEENMAPDQMYIYDGEEIVGTVEDFSKNNLAIATQLATMLGGSSENSRIYDLQLLPYCPVDLLIGDASYYKYIDVSGLEENKDFQWIKNTENEIKGIIFYPNKANFSKNITLEIKNESEYYEYQTVYNPVFTYNNQLHDGLPLYRFAGFQYDAADSTYGINADDNLRLTGDFETLDIEYLVLYNGPSGVGPIILLTSPDLPQNPTASQQVVINGTASVLAHWIMPDKPTEAKIKNECDFQRLVSPNYNGMFQFKQCRLSEGIHYINIDCTYKPYTPYIKLNPDFSGLYGRDWNDSIGLICGGDFSIPMMNNAFTNYALSNKNYEQIFNRQIENLDVNQQIAKEQQQFQGIVGIATAGIGGGTAGAMAGAKIGGG